MAESAAPLAVAQLVSDHHQALYRYAYRLSGSASDAEDLTQQAFLVAHEKLEQVRDTNAARGWLFAVLRNCYLKTRQKRLALPLAEVDCNEIPERVPEPGIDFVALERAIDSSGDDFKLVVLMFYFERCSYREIAAGLDLPIGTVMSRLARAKAHLRRMLADDETKPKPIAAKLAGPTYQQPTATRR